MGGVVTLPRSRGFDEVAAFEAGSGADECDEARCVDRPTACLGGLDELEDHGKRGGRAAGALGDLGPQPHRREGRFDGVRCAQVNPVLGREVVEPQQYVDVIAGLLGGRGPLRAVGLAGR